MKILEKFPEIIGGDTSFTGKKVKQVYFQNLKTNKLTKIKLKCLNAVSSLKTWHLSLKVNNLKI